MSESQVDTGPEHEHWFRFALLNRSLGGACSVTIGKPVLTTSSDKKEC
jgi:hypothetical protein